MIGWKSLLATRRFQPLCRAVRARSLGSPNGERGQFPVCWICPTRNNRDQGLFSTLFGMYRMHHARCFDFPDRLQKWWLCIARSPVEWRRQWFPMVKYYSVGSYEEGLPQPSYGKLDLHPSMYWHPPMSSALMLMRPSSTILPCRLYCLWEWCF